jgi:predicted ester cyclase
VSTEENKAVIRRVIEEVLNKGNMSVADEILAPNYVIHGSGGQEFKGPEGFKQFITTFRTAFPDFHVTADDMFAEGDKVAHRLTLRGTQKGEFMGIAPTNKKVEMTANAISRFAGGKEVEAWVNFDQLSMMQQLGVAPPTG